MDVDDWTGPRRDRRFEPRRVPFSQAAKAWVSQVQGRLEVLEARKRRRRAKDQATFNQAVAATLSDLAVAALQDVSRWTTVELSKQKLSAANRRAEFMTEQFPATIRLLANEQLGLVELRTAPPGTIYGFQSTLRALPALLAEVHAAGLGLTDFRKRGTHRKRGPVLELRGRKTPKFKGDRWSHEAPRLPLPDTLDVQHLLEQMETINAWLDTATLDFFADPDSDVDIKDRWMKRVFNDGDLSKGGRLYGGFWQAMSADDRLALIAWSRKGGAEATASLDFGQSSVRMAYAEVGATPPAGDLYRLTGAAREWANERDGIKAVLNALLSSDASLKRFPRGTRRYFPAGAKFERVLRDIATHHSPIAPLFGTGRGLDVMYRESLVLLRVLFRLKDDGIHALPIHDGILVADSHIDSAKTVMEEEFLAVTGVAAVVAIETSTLETWGAEP